MLWKHLNMYTPKQPNSWNIRNGTNISLRYDHLGWLNKVNKQFKKEWAWENEIRLNIQINRMFVLKNGMDVMWPG